MIDTDNIGVVGPFARCLFVFATEAMETMGSRVRARRPNTTPIPPPAAAMTLVLKRHN